ncbi:PP2C family protein-serine/threonine phosphatase [candidate division KSB1 bacterium]
MNKKNPFRKNVKRDLKEIFYFYLDNEKHGKLAKAGWIKRWLFSDWWFFKSVILKLSPFRRFFFFAGWILFFAGFGTYSGNTVFLKLSFFFLFFIILLELKDKLLAQDELAVGKEVQSALMPDENPVFKGWDIWLFNKAAKEVGGDLIDYIKIKNNKLGIALGDVAGKGLGAALLMARLQASLTALVPNFESFAELGKQLNMLLCKDYLQNKFASLVYIELESGSGDLRILNAGHLPPVKLKEGKLEEMLKGQSALGLSTTSVYEEQHTSLARGEILLVFSDGLTEARNEDGDFFGENRLNDLILEIKGNSASETGNHIITEIEKFTGYARQSDDISLIVLKRAD